MSDKQPGESGKKPAANRWRFRLTRLDMTVMGVSAALCLLLALLQFDPAARSNFSSSLLYLAPAGTRLSNIWTVQPENPADARQLTFSETGIESFTVSPDGKWVVYAEFQGETRDTRLFLMNMLTRQTQSLTDCTDSSCEHPVFAPDSRRVAYERIQFNSELPGLPPAPPRIWLVDLYSLAERPLETDSQKPGWLPLWSPDGHYLAALDRSVGGIRLYNLQQSTAGFIAKSYGTTGAFTPDSTALVFPALVEDGGNGLLLRQYHIADGTLTMLQTDVADFRPVAVSYSPDGTYLAALHLSPAAQCRSGPALYAARVLASGRLETLSVTDYCVHQITWDTTGKRLFLQRVMTDASGANQAEIWLYSPDDNTARPIITGGYHPRWLP